MLELAAILSVALTGAAPTGAEGVPSAMRTIWEIGAPDGGSAEFALGIDDFHLYASRFPGGPLYVVGRSEPGTDWAHVQPGPLDGWAGSREHTFTVRFALGAALEGGQLRIDLNDAHRTHPPRLGVRVNDLVVERAAAPGSADTLEQRPPSGRPQRLAIDLPPGTLRAGDNTVAITTLTGCWLIYDRVALVAPSGASAAAVAATTTIIGGGTRPVLRRGANGAREQTLRLFVEHAGAETAADVTVSGGPPAPVTLRTGRQHLDVPVSAVDAPASVPVALRIGDRAVAEGVVELRPVRPWVVYLLHHTHLDIGYTHVQSDVEALQWRHLESAVKLAQQTADYPSDARFRWNPEGLWAVDSYLDQAAPAARDRLVKALRSGAIGLDALYANALTGLCRPEELFELTACVRRLSEAHGITIDSAMITDIPGFTWGLVPALAHAGIRYLSVGPNRGHRIGFTLREWGDRPFWWESPCGERRILCWTAGKGYSWFHGTWKEQDTFTYDAVETAIDGERLLGYLAELEQGDYPYDLVQLRYNVGSDNGPPDPGLPDFVREWNEHHVTPRLVITTTSEMGRALEERYGDDLPVFRGDFTPYWEDGAASSARETAMNRAAAERLVQAATLFSWLDPEGYPADAFQEAWRNVLLYTEHTWGSWNSVSDPDGDFTRRQWAVKQSFVHRAAQDSLALLEEAGASKTAPAHLESVMVLNTESWPRTDLVTLPDGWDLAGDVVRNERGQTVPSQRLSTGALAFLARDVPGLGAARYTFEAGSVPSTGGAEAEGRRLSNEHLSLEIDGLTGAIRHLRRAGGHGEMVDGGAGLGLGSYLYVEGRAPDALTANGPVHVEVLERGPLVAAPRIESDAPGCRALMREVRVTAGLDRVDLVTTIDKERILEPEAVHIAFPFRVTEPAVRYDVAWGVVKLGSDQLPGACRNYLTAARWVDVSNREHGMTLATPDTPLFEVGALTADATAVGWLQALDPSATIYSYVMNNYWETNYLAGQEGPAEIRYSIQPHGAFDATAAKRFGVERSRPLIASPAPASGDAPPPLLRVEPASVMVTSVRPSDDGAALIVRLFNAAERPVEAIVHWTGGAPVTTWISQPQEDRVRPAPDVIALPAWGLVTLRCEP